MRKEFAGAAPRTKLTAQLGIGVGAGGTFTVEDGAGYPTGVYPFVISISRGLPEEEKILCSSRAGSTFTILQRAYDGTVAQTHVANSPVQHVLDADTVTVVNEHAEETGVRYTDESLSNVLRRIHIVAGNTPTPTGLRTGDLVIRAASAPAGQVSDMYAVAGPLADRPAPQTFGRIYVANDTFNGLGEELVYLDTSSSWNPLNLTSPVVASSGLSTAPSLTLTDQYSQSVLVEVHYTLTAVSINAAQRIVTHTLNKNGSPVANGTRNVWTFTHAGTNTESLRVSDTWLLTDIGAGSQSLSVTVGDGSVSATSEWTMVARFI